MGELVRRGVCFFTRYQTLTVFSAHTRTWLLEMVRTVMYTDTQYPTPSPQTVVHTQRTL